MIVFENPGEIDLRSISTFGVSVKEGDNPIGFFGTGLKYAIAVLLRTGHEVTIHAGLTAVRFGVQRDAVRGQEFEFVTMAVGDAPAAPMGFTTQLGKQWELWMAYREIACNCKDEKGEARYIDTQPDPQEGVTRIIVKGQDFEAVFADSHLYILADKPYLTVGTTEIRNRRGHSLFYRGVRVMQLNKPSLYTYNLNAKLTLTEDRTIKYGWEIPGRIAQAVLASEDDGFIRAVITASDELFEGGLELHGQGVPPSERFLYVVGETLSDRMCKVNSSAMRVWRDATKQTLAPREIGLTKVQLASLNRALDFTAKIGIQIRDTYPIKFVESLGDGTLGLAQDGTIYISERVFDIGGTKQLASTLIEEYIHLRHGWKDLTRELQTFLFEKLVSVGEELVGEPL
jgi:hypothetical protein